MKYLFLFLLMYLLPANLAGGTQSDSLARLADRARLFGERIPQEKVYVQMDNTGYFLGDTVWFAAYTRRTDTGRPSRISRVLYAELWNHDGFLVERKLVEMRDGRGHGFFALPDTLYSGYFELRAYTRWQLNWGQTEHPHNPRTEIQFYTKEMAKDYFRDYEKLYSRVFPVYDKPREAGQYVRDMTLRPLRRYFRKDEKKPGLVLSLFPEGGSLTAGVPCRVAFEAATEEGEAMQGRVSLQIRNEEIRIKNWLGEEVTEVSTEHRGRGSFTFVPEAGCTYEAVFVTDGGETAKARLGDIAREGVALQVTREDSVWRFQIHSSVDKPLGLTLMHEGVTSHFMEIDTKPNFQFSIFNFQLPTGVNQVTVFDEEGRVWADRLFFVMKPEAARATLAVTGQKEEYGPYEPVDLTLTLSGEGTVTPPLEGQGGGFSVAVRDAVRQDQTFDSGNILTEMLLSSEIKGFVPQPEWYFERDDAEHRRGLDLLMMTQGWRRFRWRDMAVPGAWEITHPAEQSQTISGSVHRYYVDNPYIETGPSGPSSSSLSLLNYLRDLNTNGLYATEIKFSDEDRFLADGGTILTPFDEGFGNQALDAVKKAGKNFGRGNRLAGDNYADQIRIKPGALNHEVLVHSELVKPDAPKGTESGVVGEQCTREGNFRMELPRFYGDCVFFLAAKDTTLWDKKTRRLWMKKYRQHNWVQTEDDEYERIHEDAEFYVRLNFPYPRWVRPYTYHQTHAAPYKAGAALSAEGGTRLMKEVTVRSRRNGRRGIDLSKPVYVLDAYEAANAAMDAGLLADLSTSSVLVTDSSGAYSYSNLGYGATSEIANATILNYVGDMGMDRRYDTALFWDSVRVAGAEVNASALFDKEMQRKYSRLEYLDKIYLYTDYSPRNEGSARYSQDDQPSVEVSLHRLPGNERRVTYRDRRYILHGFAYQEDFYHPDYSRQRPQHPTDYRRTLYWNPDLRLDEQGRAQVTLYNNCRKTQICVEAEGMDGEGRLLYNR